MRTPACTEKKLGNVTLALSNTPSTVETNTTNDKSARSEAALRAFSQVPRQWRTTLLSVSCLDTLCKPSELCNNCLLLRFSMQSEANPDPGESSSLLLATLDRKRSASFWGVQRFQPLMQGVNHLPEFADADSAFLSPIERFANEPTTSQPYNALFSFIPLSVGHTSLAVSARKTNTNEELNSTYPAYGSSASGPYPSSVLGKEGFQVDDCSA